MAVTWYVIANRAGARIVQRVGYEPVTLFEEIDHQRGRLKSSELDTDRAGSAFESGRPGVHAMNTHESAHDRVAADFTRDLARGLSAARTDRSFDRLVLVAEPHLLGMLRRALDVPTASRVAWTLNRDFTHVPMRALDDTLRRSAPYGKV
jgi:protein required for attachment to host cells